MCFSLPNFEKDALIGRLPVWLGGAEDKEQNESSNNDADDDIDHDRARETGSSFRWCGTRFHNSLDARARKRR